MSPDSNPPDDRPAHSPATGVASAVADEMSPDNSAGIPVEVVAPDAQEAGPEALADHPDGGNPARPLPVESAADARVTALEVQLAAAEKEKKDNWERYLRAAADLENLRKRQRREVDEAKLDARGKSLKEMLPVVDNLERAIEHAAAQSADGGGTNKALIEGVQLVLRQLVTAFERLEVSPIEALHQPFDPNLHEAISQMEHDSAPGTIVQVLQRGYRSGGDRLLRPALVVVAKPKSDKAQS